MSRVALERMQQELDDAMRHVEKVLTRYGVSHWKATLVVRNVAPDKPGEWVLLTMDDLGNAIHTILKRKEEEAAAAREAQG